MIQILVCDKVYVTPQLKRKKFLYKLYFILSILVIISLCSYYIYAEYDRNKCAEVSQEILNEIDVQVASVDEPDPIQSVSVEDEVIVVVLNDGSEEEIDIDNLILSTEGANEATIPKVYKSSDGTEYYTIAIVTVPKLNIQYPVLSSCSDELLKNATCKFKGPDPNKVGNFVIVGHNYRDKQKNEFFTNLEDLNKLDLIQLTDMSGKTVEYVVYDKYVVEPNDLSCTDQNTNGKREITLITCYNYGKQRTVIKAIERG